MIFLYDDTVVFFPSLNKTSHEAVTSEGGCSDFISRLNKTGWLNHPSQPFGDSKPSVHLKSHGCMLSPSLQPCCSGNARGGRAPPLPDLCRVREQRCLSHSQSLCSTGQWGVSAASPIISGESLATADMVTAPVATEPDSQEYRICTRPQGKV